MLIAPQPGNRASNASMPPPLNGTVRRPLAVSTSVATPPPGFGTTRPGGAKRAGADADVARIAPPLAAVLGIEANDAPRAVRAIEPGSGTVEFGGRKLAGRENAASNADQSWGPPPPAITEAVGAELDRVTPSVPVVGLKRGVGARDPSALRIAPIRSCGGGRKRRSL